MCGMAKSNKVRYAHIVRLSLLLFRIYFDTLINLHGDIIKSWEIETDKRERGQHIPKNIIKSIDQTLNELNQTKNKLIGIAIGAPGTVNLSYLFPIQLNHNKTY